MDYKKIKQILKEIVNIAIPNNILTSVVNKLRKLAEKIKPYQPEIYMILQKYGQYVRQHKGQFESTIKIQTELPDGATHQYDFE